VQEGLGHSSIVITLDAYGHLFARTDDGAERAEVLGRQVHKRCDAHGSFPFDPAAASRTGRVHPHRFARHDGRRMRLMRSTRLAKRGKFPVQSFVIFKHG
jgi:hypothetical protein